MSNKNNDIIIERADALLEEIVGHPSGYDKALLKAIEANDLDYLYYFVPFVEKELEVAQRAFHEQDALPFNDLDFDEWADNQMQDEADALESQSERDPI